jgi:hypothetical protein
MSDTHTPSDIPTLTAANYAAVMKKANIAVMLGTEPLPTLLSDLSNANLSCTLRSSWQVHRVQTSLSLPLLPASLIIGLPLSIPKALALLSMSLMRSCFAGLSFTNWTLSSTRTCALPSSKTRLYIYGHHHRVWSACSSTL